MNQRPLQTPQAGGGSGVECHPDHLRQLYDQRLISSLSELAPRGVPLQAFLLSPAGFRGHPTTKSNSAAVSGCFEIGGRVFTPSGAPFWA